MATVSPARLATVVLVAAAATACASKDEVGSTPATATATASSVPSTDAGTSTSPPTAPTATTVAEQECTELTIEQMAALVTWPAAATDDWEAARHAVGTVGVGGVLLMEPSSDVTLDDLRARIAELDQLSRLGVMVATDEEGGDVQRLRRYRALPSQREVSERMSPAEARDLVAEHGAFVSDVGVDVVLGPVVDVAPVDGSPSLQESRFFVGDAVAVTEFGAAYIDGWRANGLLPTLKHFPGHGSASADTHDERATTPSLADLDERDLAPYRDLAPADGSDLAVMIGHMVVPGLTDGLPASASGFAVDLARAMFGGDVLVISDALEMGAVELPLADAAVAAIGAGIDVIVFTDTAATASVVAAIEHAVDDGTVADQRLRDAADRVLHHLDHPAGCTP